MTHLRPVLLKHQARLDQVVGFFYGQTVIINLIFLFPFPPLPSVLALVGFFTFFLWGLGACVSELY